MVPADGEAIGLQGQHVVRWNAELGHGYRAERLGARALTQREIERLALTLADRCKPRIAQDKDRTNQKSS